MADFTQCSLLDQPGGEPHRGDEPIVESAEMLDAGRGDAAPHVVALVGRASQGFLAQDVLARLGRGDRRLGMERIGAAVVEEPDSLVRHEVVPVGRPPLVAVPAARPRGGPPPLRGPPCRRAAWETASSFRPAIATSLGTSGGGQARYSSLRSAFECAFPMKAYPS